MFWDIFWAILCSLLCFFVIIPIFLPIFIKLFDSATEDFGSNWSLVGTNTKAPQPMTQEQLAEAKEIRDSLKPQELDSPSSDELFSKAVEIVVESQKGSASLVQKELGVGYNRAAKLIDEMVELGILGPHNGSNPREVLITESDKFYNKLKETN